MSSLPRGHANLLCKVPIFADVPEGTLTCLEELVYKHYSVFEGNVVGIHVLDIHRNFDEPRKQGNPLVINYDNEATDGERTRKSDFNHVQVANS